MAAHLAAGADLADAGEPLDPETLAVLELPQPRIEDGALVAHALTVDRFGNVGLNVGHEQLAGSGITLGATVEIEVGGEALPAPPTPQTFADVRPGELLVYEDAYRTLAIAINRGDAAGTLGLAPDAELRLRPPMTLGSPARPPPPHRLDQRASAGAGADGRAARHAGHRRRADRRARAPGPRLDRAAGLGGADVRWCCASSSEVLPLAAAVAICEALPVECAIKWPNDVWVEGRKVAGILVEGRPQEGWAVLGIGLNVTTRASRRSWRRLPPRCDWPESRPLWNGSSSTCWLRSRSGWRVPTAEVLPAWRERDALRGQSVAGALGKGLPAGIDDTGALLVDTADGQVALGAGEVHLLH